MQTICFAAMGSTGKSVMQQATFQVDMDNAVCELDQNTLHSLPSFADGFRLTKVIAIHRIASKTFVVLLS